MTVLKKGTQVKVTLAGKEGGYHCFPLNAVVTAEGKVFDVDTSWQLFKDSETGTTQWLREIHFEVVGGTAKAPVTAKDEKGVDYTLPTKVAYAIVDKDDKIVSVRVKRSKAREVKALLGGKRKGIRIFEYVATKEIR